MSDEYGPLMVLCCDCSGSMWGEVNGKRAIDWLREAVARMQDEAKTAGTRVALVCFNNAAWLAQSITDDPYGGTAMDAGLKECARLNPAKVIVVSDGEPNDPEAALSAARECPGVIDMIYVGIDGNKHAIEFMNKLVKIGAGAGVVRELGKASELLGTLREMLALPAPRA